MKIYFLPFKLGEHYEKWEFQLEYLARQDIANYDAFIFLGFIRIFGNKTKSIIMYFQLDILKIVILKFHSENLTELNKLKKDFEKLISTSFSKKQALISFKVEILENNILEITYRTTK